MASVGTRPLDGRGVLLGMGGVGRVLTSMRTCTWSRSYAVAVGCYCRFWNAKSVDIPLCTPPWHNMCSCGAGEQACRIQVLKVLGRTWSAAVNKRRPKNCETTGFVGEMTVFICLLGAKAFTAFTLKSHEFLLARAPETWSTASHESKKHTAISRPCS